MRQTTLPIPEVGAIALTRALLGTGVGLVLSNSIPAEHKKKVGWTLIAIGALTTVPLVVDMLRRSSDAPR
ncbi:MAG: hypothetical protein U0S12_02060 [Fimbriimonadales bacterium]